MYSRWMMVSPLQNKCPYQVFEMYGFGGSDHSITASGTVHHLGQCHTYLSISTLLALYYARHCSSQVWGIESEAFL